MARGRTGDSCETAGLGRTELLRDDPLNGALTHVLLKRSIFRVGT